MMVASRKMRIAYDNRWCGQHGIGRYAREITARAPDGVQLLRLNVCCAIRNPMGPVQLGARVRATYPDLLWSPGFIPPLGVDVPYVLTVHDLTHLRYGSALQKQYYKSVIKPLAKRAQAILTVSEFSRGEIIEWLGIPASRVHMFPNGVSSEFTSVGNVWNSKRPYLLYVGNRKRHKNVPRLLRAFAAARLPEEVLLALSGECDRVTIGYCRRLGVENRVRFLGLLADQQLAEIYRGALAAVFVSLCEGFCLPAAEAMACGTAVVASNTSGLGEVVSDAGLRVCPTEVGDITHALERVVSDSELRRNLKAKGLERARMFDWERTGMSVWGLIANLGTE